MSGQGVLEWPDGKRYDGEYRDDKRAGRGVYTVVTGEAYIVVNGIVASPYGGINPTVAHVYYNLHRLAYAVAPRALLLASQAWVEAATNTVAAYVL
jgi:hypothetical protein